MGLLKLLKGLFTARLANGPNTLVCDKIQPFPFASGDNPWLDQINLLCCRYCDTSYLVTSQNADEALMDHWDGRVSELRAAVDAEHAAGHPTRRLIHNGNLVRQR